MENPGNPLLCDFESGMCESPLQTTNLDNQPIELNQKKVKIVYFTDPICSSCWGIEPQLRKLELEYGGLFEIDYRMGGLLPDWSYNSGGISNPADVARHWDEASAHYKMPIDGDVWLEDPLTSSYPPSIAFKAAQLQDKQKALNFLRRIKEMVFLEKKNIARWEHLREAASQVGLNADLLKQDYDGAGRALFLEDLDLSKKLGVRGFPTLFLANEQQERRMVYGARPYQVLEAALLELAPGMIKKNYDITTREFAELSGRSLENAAAALEQLIAEQKIKKLVTKNGNLWIYG